MTLREQLEAAPVGSVIAKVVHNPHSKWDCIVYMEQKRINDQCLIDGKFYSMDALSKGRMAATHIIPPDILAQCKVVQE